MNGVFVVSKQEMKKNSASKQKKTVHILVYFQQCTGKSAALFMKWFILKQVASRNSRLITLTAGGHKVIKFHSHYYI